MRKFFNQHMDFFHYFYLEYYLQITKHEIKKTVHLRLLLHNQGKLNIQHSCQLPQSNKSRYLSMVQHVCIDRSIYIIYVYLYCYWLFFMMTSRHFEKKVQIWPRITRPLMVFWTVHWNKYVTTYMTCWYFNLMFEQLVFTCFIVYTWMIRQGIPYVDRETFI